MVDLSLPNLMRMSSEELRRDILDNPQALVHMAGDERHVRVLLFHMLRIHIELAEEFNRTSTLLSARMNKLTWALAIMTAAMLLIQLLPWFIDLGR
jgi:hypothetical protein